MLKDGEKGTVLQRDRETYAIAPHLPCGVITPEQLRKLAEVAEKYRVPFLKITGACRIGLFGIKEEDVDAVWRDLEMPPGRLIGFCVRSVRACAGNTWCRLGQGDSLALGRKLDEIYHGKEMVNKLKIAVSGCPINCAEGWVRDIGLFAQGKSGWVLTAGGNVGSRPRIGKEVLRGLDDEAALKAVELAVGFYLENAKRGERMGRMLERMGLEPLQEFVRRGLAGSDPG